MVKSIIRKRDGKVVNLYLDGKLKEILDGFKFAVMKKNTSVVAIADGRSGMGKSTFSFQIGLYLDNNFGLDKIFYSPEDFLEGLSKAKRGDCLVFDEAMLISSRSALSLFNKMVVQAMSMIRSKNLYIIFNVNSIFDLDRNLALSRADILFNIYGEHLYDRGKFMTFFKGKDGNDRLKKLYLLGKKYYDYSKPKANFYGRFTTEFIVDEQEYEKRKQIAVNDFLKGNEKSETKTLLSRNKVFYDIYDRKLMTIKELSESSGLTERQVFSIMAKERKRRGLKAFNEV